MNVTPELIAIFGAAIALYVQQWRGQRENREAQRETRRDIADLRERMARLEGLFEEFTQRGTPEAVKSA